MDKPYKSISLLHKHRNEREAQRLAEEELAALRQRYGARVLATWGYWERQLRPVSDLVGYGIIVEIEMLPSVVLADGYLLTYDL